MRKVAAVWPEGITRPWRHLVVASNRVGAVEWVSRMVDGQLALMNMSGKRNADAVAALLQGARNFREREYGGEGNSLMRTLATGQQPGAVMIACADSRVDPALIFGARPGELLVARAVANLVPPPDSNGPATGIMAVVELGLKTLRIPHLIVCGHSGCAGVRAALDDALQERGEPEQQDSGRGAAADRARRPRSAANQGALAKHGEMTTATSPRDACLRDWIAAAAPACREIIAAHGESPIGDLTRRAEQRSVLQSLANLRARPWLRELESRGELSLHGWWFDIPSGELWSANPDTGDFIRII